MTPRLSRRLRAVLDLVPDGAGTIADVGAGHGALSAHLAACGRRVIAVESQPGPFDELRRNLTAWRVGDGVATRRGDGLAVLERGEVDTVVIAGVGAHRALRIAGAAAGKGVRWLVLQCMQHSVLVEPWMDERGWPVLRRTEVDERGHRYESWLVEVVS